MEIFETSYACSPFTLSGSFTGARSTGTWTAPAFGHEGGVRVLAPVALPVQGTSVSIAMRDRMTVIAPNKDQATQLKATALLPISVAVDTDGYAGIRSWSPPV